MFHFTRESNDEGKRFLPRDATRTMISKEVIQNTAPSVRSAASPDLSTFKFAHPCD